MLELEVISHYGRDDAIQEGILIDVSHIAKRAGIQYPVAITHNLNCHIKDDEQLWDLLWLFRLKAMQHSNDQLKFNATLDGQLITIWAICSPGDLHEPVITIMLPEDY